MSYTPPPPPPGGGQMPPPPPPIGNYGEPPAVPNKNSKALCAMISGIFSILCCGPLGILALVLGLSAKKEIQASGGAQTGGGMATAGIVLGALALVWMVVATILFATGVLTFNMDFSTSP